MNIFNRTMALDAVQMVSFPGPERPMSHNYCDLGTVRPGPGKDACGPAVRGKFLMNNLILMELLKKYQTQNMSSFDEYFQSNNGAGCRPDGVFPGSRAANVT